MESDMLTPENTPSHYEYISPIGYSASTKCGYCGTRGKGYAYYANAVTLSPEFYQTLLDRCWRRSGTLLYRPDQRRSCCPHYTLRLDSRQFKPSRVHRQTINRFNKFIIGDTYLREAARLYPRSRQEAKKRDNHFDLIERIHEAESTSLKSPPHPAHVLEVTLEENTFTEEKFGVYSNYQQTVHKDKPEDISRASFKNFLCNSPLRRETLVAEDGRRRRLGSYHQCYRLDGKLVAIGVLDLLPQCVSSVYFLYHESVQRHMPGKLGALYEIALALEDGYRWWYPGFYIHSCAKMRYKMEYQPQYVLDPESLQWDPLDQTILNLLDKKPFVSLSLERKGKNATAEPSTNSLGKPFDKVKAPADTSDLSKDDEDEDDKWLFSSGMPGIPSLGEVAALNMDHIPLRAISNGPLFETSDLVSWKRRRVDQWPGLKAGVAELIAALGPDLMKSICLDFVPRVKRS